MAWGKYRVCRAAFLWSCGCEVLALICQKECQKICQKACQKICQKECQKECQKICQKDVRKNIGRYVKRYVRKNVRRYIRRYVRKKICQKERQKIASSQSAKLRVTECISGDELYVYPHLTRSGWHKWMWRENSVIDKMETRWAQSMTFGFGFGVFKRRMLNRGRCITGVMWKWNFVRSCWCCCLRRGGGLDAETKRSSSTNWHPILSWIHSQTASLLELDNNPHLTTSTQHVMVGIARSKVINMILGKNCPYLLMKYMGGKLRQPTIPQTPCLLV